MAKSAYININALAKYNPRIINNPSTKIVLIETGINIREKKNWTRNLP